MTDSILIERYELAAERIRELAKGQEETGTFTQYINTQARLLVRILDVNQNRSKSVKEDNQFLYQDICGENYEKSFTNPTYVVAAFGEDIGSYLCFFATHIREAIVYAYKREQLPILLRMELFLQVCGELSGDSEDLKKELKEILYYYINDYSDLEVEWYLDELLDSSHTFYSDIIMNSDFSDDTYLYQYGEYISDNEIKMAAYLAGLQTEELAKMARTFTSGFEEGFRLAGIDLSKKKTVNIRYRIGLEPMVREVIKQFKEIGLEPLIGSKLFVKASDVETTAPNRQYAYDHRFDDSLYFNHALNKKRLMELEQGFGKRKELAAVYAGPAVIEVFGESLFVPQTKAEQLHYSKTQEKLSVESRRDRLLIQKKYIKMDEYSFSIISYPIPEIGEQFEAIFNEMVKVNTLDIKKYEKIQQCIIDALDEGKYVTVTGRGNNKTNIRVSLHELHDKEKETNFENCLADVNIPLGEVFTSPVLNETNGILHVTQVYLEGLCYKDFELVFKDGMIIDYNCSNYKNTKENKKYMKENVLNNHDTLPMGEFAIGTNTTAYQMGQKYEIADQLPILIAEKTGPHFAVGDTCYSMSEDVIVKNPDGKEVIARENECSVLRKTEITKAYFNCHTDITIPYSELGDICVHTKEGQVIPIIQGGRFVLSGTEELSEVLD